VGGLWPTPLISLVILGFSTVLLRKAWENGMLSGHAVASADRVMTFLAVYTVSVPTIRYVLGKSFRSFRVVLLLRNLSSSAEVLPASFRRSIRVWREFSWRTVVYSLIVRFAGAVALSLALGDRPLRPKNTRLITHPHLSKGVFGRSTFRCACLGF